jgi:integrase/recombinase XerD
MTQAATLTQQQLHRVLEYTRTRRHYKRNRAIILLTHYAMLRVGEVAALRYCDVVDADGEIKAETTLSAAQTKGNKARKVWFAEKIRVELAAYVAAHKPKQLAGVSWILCKRNSLILRHPIAELNSKTIKRSFPVSYWQRPFPADILLC